MNISLDAIVQFPNLTQTPESSVPPGPLLAAPPPHSLLLNWGPQRIRQVAISEDLLRPYTCWDLVPFDAPGKFVQLLVLI